MSRGPGRIELGILAAFDEAPHNAFTVDDLADRIFPSAVAIEKKHRVSICRAIRTLSARFPGEYCIEYASDHGTMIVGRMLDLASYTMAKLKADATLGYRPKPVGRHWRSWDMVDLTPAEQEAALLRFIEPGEKHYEAAKEGGAWWRTVRLRQAYRNNEQDVISSIEEQIALETERIERLLRAFPSRGWLGANATRMQHGP